MSGDDKGQTGPMGGQDGWVGSSWRVVSPSVLAAAAAAASSGTHFECWMSKRESPSEDGLEQQRGTHRRRTACDWLPELR